MKRVLVFLHRLIEDDDGQASTEYILMMAIGIAMTISLVKKFIQPYLAKMADAYSAQLQKTLFSKANMHSLRIGGH